MLTTKIRMPTIIANSKIYHFGDLDFYAQDGVIHLIDKRDGTHKQLSIEEWRSRLEAIMLFGSGLEASPTVVECEQYRSSLKGVTLGMLALKDAWEQGDPLNDKVAEQIVDDYLRGHRTLPAKYTKKPKGLDYAK